MLAFPKRETSGDALDGLPKLTRSKTKNMFVKFAGLISSTFTNKGNRKEDRSYDATNESISVGEVKPAHIINGPPLPRLVLDPLPITTSTMRKRPSSSEDINFEMFKEPKMTGRVRKSSRLPAITKKRLTIVDEVGFDEDCPPDDPFSNYASSHRSADPDVEAKKSQNTALNLADPFEAERLLDSNTDAILNTPPVGFSTPRRRSRSYGVRCPTPTRGPKDPSFDGSDLITFSDAGSPAKYEQRLEISHVSGSPARKPIQGENPGQQSEEKSLFDLTRLSSYPPGSTIRHVPRSIGRLVDVPVLSAPATQQNGLFLVNKKKHPSPSKVQLEMYGKFMENNLALGVFQDPDELGLSFAAPSPSPQMLSVRDANRMMRGGGTTTSKNGQRKSHISYENPVLSSTLKSRIPQPIKQVSRSRTETTLAKKFYPANADDMSTEDELQWDESKIGQRCIHCGSMNKL